MIPCKYCSTPTDMTATEMCDCCWEIRRWLEGSKLEVLRKIFADLGIEDIHAPDELGDDQ